MNLRSGDVLTAQFNPEELKREFGVNYERLAILGMSHEQLQFKNRGNEKYTFTLFFDSRSTDNDTIDPKDIENRIDAMTLGSEQARDIAGGGPPDVLFEWGDHLLLNTRIMGLKYSYKRFTRNGIPVHFSVEVSLEEARDQRLYAEDVLRYGLQRERG